MYKILLDRFHECLLNVNKTRGIEFEQLEGRLHVLRVPVPGTVLSIIFQAMDREDAYQYTTCIAEISPHLIRPVALAILQRPIRGVTPSIPQPFDGPFARVMLDGWQEIYLTNSCEMIEKTIYYSIGQVISAYNEWTRLIEECKAVV
jgi:hypothetical protein